MKSILLVLLSFVFAFCSNTNKERHTTSRDFWETIDEYEPLFKDFLIKNKFHSKNDDMSEGILNFLNHFYLDTLDEKRNSIKKIYEHYNFKCSKLIYPSNFCNRVEVDSSMFENLIIKDTILIDGQNVCMLEENLHHLYYKSLFEEASNNKLPLVINTIIEDRKDRWKGIDIERLISIYFIDDKDSLLIEYDDKFLIRMLIVEFFLPNVKCYACQN